MQAGTRVRLDGLSSRPELNGTEARLVTWFEDAGRWSVKVGGEHIRVKPANVKLASLKDVNAIGLKIWDATTDGDDRLLARLLACSPPGPWGDVQDGAGTTALAAAAAIKSRKCVALLLPVSDVHKANGFGSSAVHRAAEGGCIDCLQMLLDAGATPHAPDAQGQTPLCYAAEEGATECARLLLKMGASANVRYRGCTPYQWAVVGDHDKCMKLLAPHTDDAGVMPPIHDPVNEAPVDEYNPQQSIDAFRVMMQKLASSR